MAKSPPITSISVGCSTAKIYESVVTVRGPDAELNAVNDRYVLRGDLNLGLGTLRVEEGALASAKEIVVGTTRGYDSHLIATGAGSRVTSNFQRRHRSGRTLHACD